MAVYLRRRKEQWCLAGLVIFLWTLMTLFVETTGGRVVPGWVAIGAITLSLCPFGRAIAIARVLERLKDAPPDEIVTYGGGSGITHYDS